MICHLRSMEIPLGVPRVLEAQVVSNEEVGPATFRLGLRLPDPLEIAPGQFAMLRCDGAEPPVLLRRPFSVADAWSDGDGQSLVFLHRVVGPGTAALSQRRPRQRVSLLAPLGRGFRPDAPPGTLHVLAAGGIGIAPFPLLARRLAARGERCVLLFGGRSAADICPRDAFDRLGIEVRVATEDGSLGVRGFVTALLGEILEKEPAGSLRVYSCGPNPMLRAVENLARPRGVVHQASLEETMACGFGVCVGCAVPVRADLLPGLGATPEGVAYARACAEGPVFDGDEVVWDAIPEAHPRSAVC